MTTENNREAPVSDVRADHRGFGSASEGADPGAGYDTHRGMRLQNALQLQAATLPPGSAPEQSTAP